MITSPPNRQGRHQLLEPNNELHKHCPQDMGAQKNSTEEAANSLRMAASHQHLHLEGNNKTTSQFRSKGEASFSLLARRMSNFVIANKHIEASCQKGRTPAFPDALSTPRSFGSRASMQRHRTLICTQCVYMHIQMLG